MMKLAVLSCLVAAAASSAILPIGYATPWAYSAWLGAPNYRGPLSLAPGQPANIIAADGRPLDTLDVNLDRSAHLTAKALDNAGIHLLKKRSAVIATAYNGFGFGAPLIAGAVAPIAYSARLLTPTNYRGPLSLAPGQPANILAADGRPLDTLDVNLDRSAHFTAKALEGSGIHLLKKRSAVLATPINHIAYSAPLITSAVAPLITPAVAPLAYSTHIAAPIATPISYASPFAHALY